MAIIQMNDVPLIETTKPNGFTQFSLAFKCVYPSKLSVGERVQIIPFPLTGEDVGTTFLKYRLYDSFSAEESRGPDDVGGEGEPEGIGVTSYRELHSTSLGLGTRKYSDVRLYNPTNLIEDEDNITTDIPPNTEGLTLVNKGNYFAFPIYVFEAMVFNDTRDRRGGRIPAGAAPGPVPGDQQHRDRGDHAGGQGASGRPERGWRGHQHRAARRGHRGTPGLTGQVR